MNPYLSIVMGIGGDLGGGLADRLCNSLANTIALAEEFGVPSEVVLVIWNAPNFKFKLGEAVSLACPVRVIQTGDLHSRVPNPHGFRYFEWYPKNIGIRCARGEFVLSTNPDDILSDALFSYFAKPKLQHGYFYRVNRHDTRDGEIYRVCWASGAFPIGTPKEVINRGLPRALPLFHNPIHYNASGDFTLMGRDEWFLIHGNPERDYNHTVDGQTLFLAHQKGLKQIILPYPIFHPDHPRTLNVSRTGAFVGPEWDDHFPFTQENGEDWGFAGMEFEETIL